MGEKEVEGMERVKGRVRDNGVLNRTKKKIINTKTQKGPIGKSLTAVGINTASFLI